MELACDISRVVLVHWLDRLWPLSRDCVRLATPEEVATIQLVRSSGL
jgi:hypothetical protein